MQKSFIVENVEVDLSNLTEKVKEEIEFKIQNVYGCLLYTSPSPRD